MHTYKHILVPIDFSKISEMAAGQAIELAKCYRARVTLLHVVERFPEHLSHYHMSHEQMEPKEFLIDRAEKDLTDLSARVGIKDAAKEVVLSHHSAKTEIVRFVESHDIDLIVLGARGRHGLTDLLGGSTATGVVRVAPCDVFTVRGEN
ncbi:MAG: universal stress protein [Pseudomonadota bacterium]